MVVILLKYTMNHVRQVRTRDQLAFILSTPFICLKCNTGFSGMWDAVVTCFFIDTAHNIIEYIETISKILKDGGVNFLCYSFLNSFDLLWLLTCLGSMFRQVWINLGPLLYHFADTYGLGNVCISTCLIISLLTLISQYIFHVFIFRKCQSS